MTHLNADDLVSDERLAEMLRAVPRHANGKARSSGWVGRVPAPELEAILSELQSRRAAMQDGAAVADLLIERHRQVAKGYDAAHDDQHRDREIIVDPIWGAYVRLDNALGINDPASYQRELIQVAAMIVAEIERSRREVQQ